MASIAFESSHVTGDCASGRLEVTLARQDDASGQTVYDQISFAVPPDFYTHNDSVAAALLTLVGGAYTAVTFNFAISRRCADTLAGFYELDLIGPVDEWLAPRRPGSALGLNFSGGFDSVALWLVLRRRLGLDVKVITTEFGGWFEREQVSYRRFPRAVSCRTDFRLKGYDQSGPFMAAVPLLFADYLDLRSLAHGHEFGQHRDDIDDFRDGRTPRFVAREAALRAGGLDELHLVRGLTDYGMLTIVARSGPEFIREALTASAGPGTLKLISKAYMLRHVFESAGLPVPPAVLEAAQAPPTPDPERVARPTLRTLFVAKFYGIEAADRMVPGLRHFDVSFLDGLSCDFYRRHNTRATPYIAPELRAGMLAAFAANGIAPFEDNDWRELDIVSDYVASCRTQLT